MMISTMYLKAPKAKETKGGKGTVPDGPEVPEGQKLVVDPTFAPTHVIEVHLLSISNI
jgi:hypothetical protein